MRLAARLDAGALGASDRCFNASLARRDGGYWLAFRCGLFPASVWLAPLDSQLRAAGQSRRLSLQHEEANCGQEDPRLFWHRDALHVAFTGVAVWLDGDVYASQLYARVDGGEVVSPERAGYWEKNWQFFEWGRALWHVYSVSPWVVLQVGELAQCAPGAEHGSTPPIMVGGEHWMFYHWRDGPVGYEVYSVGLLAFGASPPFAVRRATRRALLVADPATRPPGQRQSVVFPCGAVLDGERVLLSVGAHDNWVEVWEWPVKELNWRLE